MAPAGPALDPTACAGSARPGQASGKPAFVFRTVLWIRPDPYVFGPPRSGSVIILYGFGSFYQQAKQVRKTLISTIL